jgi:hypothetical protein
VSDIHEIRAQLRRGRGPAAAAGRMLWFAACGAGLLVLGVWLMPLFFPLQSSPSLPTWSDVQASIANGQPTPHYRPDPAVQSRPPVKASYEGKSASEVGKVADEVCFQRAHQRFPHWSKTPRLTTKELSDFHLDDMDHFNELMRCLLVEGLPRYCSASERRMVSAEVAMYFRVIAQGNRALERWRQRLQSPMVNPSFARVQEQLGTTGIDPDYLKKAKDAEFVYDSGVLNAIEARLRDGLLTKAERDHFAPLAPQQIRERFARVEPRKSACPDEPWWAFWL